MCFSPRWISRFEIKKDSWVFVPTEDTVTYGKEVKSLIESKWNPPNYYFHLRSGGHVKALKLHTNNEYFIHLDIKSFFGCISKNRITRNLKRYFGYGLAREIATLSTVNQPRNTQRKTILPFGFVQSPVLASICLHKSKFGAYLEKLNTNKNGITVTVYMDDIIISSESLESLTGILPVINEVAEKSLLPLNPDKQEGPASKITSFNIELSNQSLEITPERMILFSREYHFSTNDDVRNGILGYINSVNPGQVLDI